MPNSTFLGIPAEYWEEWGFARSGVDVVEPDPRIPTPEEEEDLLLEIKYESEQLRVKIPEYRKNVVRIVSAVLNGNLDLAGAQVAQLSPDELRSTLVSMSLLTKDVIVEQYDGDQAAALREWQEVCHLAAAHEAGCDPYQGGG